MPSRGSTPRYSVAFLPVRCGFTPCPAAASVAPTPSWMGSVPCWRPSGVGVGGCGSSAIRSVAWSPGRWPTTTQMSSPRSSCTRHRCGAARGWPRGCLSLRHASSPGPAVGCASTTGRSTGRWCGRSIRSATSSSPRHGGLAGRRRPGGEPLRRSLPRAFPPATRRRAPAPRRGESHGAPAPREAPGPAPPHGLRSGPRTIPVRRLPR